MKTSIVIPSRNEGQYLRRTVDAIRTNTSGDYEIIIVDESTDGSADFFPSAIRPSSRIGAIASRNMGAAHAKGDFIVFMDANIETSPGWLDGILTTAQAHPQSMITCALADINNNNNAPMYGLELDPVTLIGKYRGKKSNSDYEIPVCSGAFMCMPKSVFEGIDRFDEGFKLWGMEDVDISVKCWELGYSIILNPNVTVKHLYKPAGSASPEQWTYNAMRTACMVFDGARLDAIKAHFRQYVGDNTFHQKIMPELDLDVQYQIKCVTFKSTRVHDGEWFWNRRY